MAKYILIMRADDAATGACRGLPLGEVIAAMGAYNQALIKAGVLAAGEGLASEPGVVVDFSQRPQFGLIRASRVQIQSRRQVRRRHRAPG